MKPGKVKQIDSGRVYKFNEEYTQCYQMTMMGLVFLFAFSLPSIEDADMFYADLGK